MAGRDMSKKLHDILLIGLAIVYLILRTFFIPTAKIDMLVLLGIAILVVGISTLYLSTNSKNLSDSGRKMELMMLCSAFMGMILLGYKLFIEVDLSKIPH